jgi:hypothetical protein
MVLLPAGIYQHRVSTFYNNNLSVDINDTDDYDHDVANKYLNYSSHREDLSGSEVGSDDYNEAKKQYVKAFINNLNNISPSYDFDTIIKPGIETIFVPDQMLILSQSGDSTTRYKSEHIWIVRLNKNKNSKSPSGHVEGTLNMFSPNLFFKRNQNRIYEKFDSSQNIFEIFYKEYLSDIQFPETKDETEFNWNEVLLDSSYYIESQKVDIYDKKEVSKITDHRLNKTYSKYIFITKLIDQNVQLEDYVIGVNIRGQHLLLAPSDFYVLKRLEYFLYKRFNIKSLEYITPELVDKHAAELQDFGTLVRDMERDYGKEYVYYDRESIITLLISIYIVTSVLALILLVVRLLNFRLLVISLLGLAILSFILFVPMMGFRINPLGVFPAIFLSILYGYFIFSILRIFYAKGTTVFMRISALSGLIVLPLIVLYYFGFYIFIMKFGYYTEEKDTIFFTGIILIVLFLIGHIPLIAKIIHRLFYLPKR